MREQEERAAALKAQEEEAAAQRAAAAQAAADEAAAAAAAARREHWLSQPEPAEGAASAVSLAIRYPDGTRVSRRFDSALPVATLFEAISALGPPALGGSFSVAAGFPRRVLDGGAGTSLSEAGLQSGDALLVSAS